MEKSGLELGAFEQRVMLTVLRLNPNGYGISIRDELEARTGRSVSFGSVYATLERLEDKGLVTRREGEATAERGGRRKSYFTLTPPGKVTLQASLRAVDALRSGLDIERLGIESITPADADSLTPPRTPPPCDHFRA